MSGGYLLVEAAELPAENHWLGPAERAQLARLPAAPRRADWRLGRWAAKRALLAWLGVEPGAESWSRLEILADGDGRPDAVWRSRPLALGLSISHRAGRALAVVGAAGAALGCDLEMVEPRTPAFVADFLTVAEGALVDAAAPPQRALMANLIWSAKESALKLRRVGLSVDTRSVEIALDGSTPRLGWSGFRATDTAHGDALTGWWRLEGPFVFTFCSHPLGAPPRSLSAADASPRRGVQPA